MFVLILGWILTWTCLLRFTVHLLWAGLACYHGRLHIKMIYEQLFSFQMPTRKWLMEKVVTEVQGSELHTQNKKRCTSYQQDLQTQTILLLAHVFSWLNTPANSTTGPVMWYHSHSQMFMSHALKTDSFSKPGDLHSSARPWRKCHSSLIRVKH